MGYIEDLAAKEAARRDMEAAKKVEAARVLNQGDLGLAGMATQVPYGAGISVEDAQRLAIAQQAQKVNEQKAIQDMIAKNRNYNATNAALAERDTAAQASYDAGGDVGGNTDILDGLVFNPIDKAAVQRYQDSVDQGLADKWKQSYNGR